MRACFNRCDTRRDAGRTIRVCVSVENFSSHVFKCGKYESEKLGRSKFFHSQSQSDLD